MKIYTGTRIFCVSVIDPGVENSHCGSGRKPSWNHRGDIHRVKLPLVVVWSVPLLSGSGRGRTTSAHTDRISTNLRGLNSPLHTLSWDTWKFKVDSKLLLALLFLGRDLHPHTHVNYVHWLVRPLLVGEAARPSPHVPAELFLVLSLHNTQLELLCLLSPETCASDGRKFTCAHTATHVSFRR